MFEHASKCLKKNLIHLVKGDGIRLLSEYVNIMPNESTICIFHTHVANQMQMDEKKLLLKVVDSIGKERDLFHIYNNVQDKYLHLDYFLDGVESKQIVAETEGHGRWFRWLLN